MNDMDFSRIAFNANQPQTGDERLMVLFQMLPVKDEEASLREGRPIYEEREHVEIRVPGGTDIVVREVRPEDKARFRKAYGAWKAGQDQGAAAGTPLAAWPAISRAQVEELKHFGVHTVEQLAGMPDNVAQRFMGINALRQQAAAFIAAAKEAAPLTALRADMAKKDEELAVLKSAVEDLKKALEAKDKLAKGTK